MAKKKDFIDNTKYVPQLLEDIMGAGFGRYAKHIIQERALPDARDGLKPVQRRILYGMYEEGNTHDHPYRKSAKTVGSVMGNYHPHGDSSIYDAMVRMSQDWKMRIPLIDMQGNNGSIDDDPAAAMRYTEARLAQVTEVMVDDLGMNTVEMAPNFDDTAQEPTVLPVPFPVMLVNGATGIAAGYATNMPPHNLGEVIDATICRIRNPLCTLDDILAIMPGPDFPTGGIVQGEKGVRDAYSTGKGRIVVRSKCQIVPDKKFNTIIISEIPYEVVKQQLVKKMDEIRVSKEIDGIIDVRDESDRQGMRIVIEVNKDADAQMILNYFYKNTDLQVYYSYNNVAIINRSPVQVGVLSLLDAFIDFRREVVLRRARYNIDKWEEDRHKTAGLIKAVSILDEVIRIIRASKDKADSKKNLMAEFGFDEPQAEAIVTMQLYRLSNTDIVELQKKYGTLTALITDEQAVIDSPDVLNSRIINKLREIKEKYNTPRRTRIEKEVSEIIIDKAQMITSEHVVVTLTRDGYVKRVSMRSYGAASSQPTGMKTDDMLVGIIECDTTDTLLVFTDAGHYISLPVWQIDDARWKDNGMHLNKVVRITSEDKVIKAMVVKNFSTYAWIVTLSDQGQIKKTPVSAWQVTKTNKVYPAMSIAAGRKILLACAAYENDQVAIVSRDGFAYRFPVSDIPSTGVKSKGVKAMNLAKGDVCACGCILRNNDDALCLVTESGMMKRVRIEEIPEGNRPMKGVQVCRKLKISPSRLAYAKAITPGEEIVFCDPEEKTVKATDIPLRPRESGFATVVALADGWKVRHGIEEIKVIDIPEGNSDEVHDDVEKIALF